MRGVVNIQPILIGAGLLSLFSGMGGTVKFGLGSLKVGGVTGAVLLILGVLL